jgi:hypothetical protein
MAGMQDKSAFRAFDQMVEKVEESERRALAAAEVTEDLEGDDLTREFAMLESTGGETDVDEKLLALKRDMGLLGPATSTEEPRALGAGEVEVADAEILDDDEPVADDEPAAAEAEVNEAEAPKE